MIRLTIFLFLITACSTHGNESNKERKHKDLIFFKSPFLAELGEDSYDSLLAEINKEKLTVDYFKDIIYVSQLIETNACGNYQGNIEISNDTIYLKFEVISDEVCTSTAIEKPTYIINNPSLKKYIIQGLK